jgi:uncharacterized protein
MTIPLSFFDVAIIGFLAQIIDGALGMGYGVVSSSLLISLGTLPVIASASVHTAELFATFISGISHLKFGNVKKEIIRPLIYFGVFGGIVGAIGLIKLPLKLTKLVVGFILLSMGVLIFYHFLFRFNNFCNKGAKKYSINKLRGLGFFAAFIDAIGGGGWGPICTPTLVMTGTEPNEAVGSVDFAEFFVTLAITCSFVLLVGIGKFSWQLIFALLIGGAIGAPIAAFICKKLPKRLLGILVGVLVIILSYRMIILG